MDNPLVSVVMPTYNHAPYISQAIEGALMQKTDFDFEILIGEDGSEDGTREICKEYAAKHPDKIRLFLNDRKNVIYINGQPTGRWNFMNLLKNAKGKYIALCDGDDYWTYSYKMQKQINFLNLHPDCAACFHNAKVEYVGKSTKSKNFNTPNQKKISTIEDLLDKNFISTASIIYRRGLFDGFPTWFSDIKMGDWVIHILNAQHGHIGYINEVMSVYRIHQNGTWSSMTEEQRIKEKIRFYQCLILHFGERYYKKINGCINNLKSKLADTLNYKKDFSSSSNTPVTMNNYLDPLFAPENMDYYFVRSAIKKAIDDNLHNFCGTLLDVGCGEMPYRNYLLANSDISKYIGLDIVNNNYQKKLIPDIIWDGRNIGLNDASVDCAIATEVLEHVPRISIVLKEIYRVLRPGGRLFFTVPYLWPLHDAPYDEYRYTPFSLKRHLDISGFKNVTIKALGGWNASLAQMIGLWIHRSGLPIHDRQRYAHQFFPFYRALIESDTTDFKFTSQTMYTGLYGIALKKNVIVGSLETNNKPIEIQISDKDRQFSTKSYKKKRIAVMQGGFPALSITFIIDMMCGLIDHGFDIENWATYIPDEYKIHKKIKEYDLLSKTKYLKFPSEKIKSEPLNWTEEFCKLNGVAGFNDIDSFHIHYGSNFNLVEPLFKYLDNKYVVVSFHGYDASKYFQENGDTCYEYLFERADKITTPSFEMKRELIKRECPSNKIMVHRYGVDLNKFSNLGKKKVKPQVKLLTVARLVEKKGIEFSLRAFANLPNREKAQYKIIGDGPLKKDLKNLTFKLKIDKQVEFLGAKTKREVIREMADADIYLLNSVTALNGDKEGLPVSLIEAQAMGLPAISSYHAGIPELIIDGKTGFLTEEKNVDQIAIKLNELIVDQQIRSELASNARNNILREYNIHELNERLSIIFAGRIDLINGGFPAVDSDNCQKKLYSQLEKHGWIPKFDNYKQYFEFVRNVRRINNPFASIVVISSKISKETKKCLSMLNKQKGHHCELVFVDNGGSVEQVEVLKPISDTYIKLNKNTGAYVARNIGAIFAEGLILIFVDDDAVPSSDLIKKHLEIYDRNCDIWAVRGKCYPKNKNDKLADSSHYNLGESPFPYYLNLEGNMSIKSDKFFMANGFSDEIIFGYGGAELSYRLKIIAGNIEPSWYFPGPTIYHDYANKENFEEKKRIQENSLRHITKKHPNFESYLLNYRKLLERYRNNTRIIDNSKDVSQSKIYKSGTDQLKIVTKKRTNRSPLKSITNHQFASDESWKLMRAGAEYLFKGDILKINWVITRRCNYKCSYCTVHSNRNGFSPSLDLMKKAAGRIKNLNRSEVIITLTGGEPTIHPEYIDLLKYLAEQLKDSGKIATITNLSRPNGFIQNLCDELIDYKENLSFNTSFHFEFASIDSFTKNIETLVSNGFSTRLNILAHPDYMKEIDILINQCQKINSKHFCWDVIVVRENYGTEPDKRYDKNQLDQLKKWYSNKNEKGIILDKASKSNINHIREYCDAKDLIARGLNRFSGMYCNAGINMLSINENGDIDPAVCFRHTKGSKKNIYHDTEALTVFKSPLICPHHACGCLADLELPKYLSGYGSLPDAENLSQCRKKKNWGEPQKYPEDLNDDLLKLRLAEKKWDCREWLYKKYFENAYHFQDVENPLISVIVISWRNHPDTIHNFEALTKQRNTNFELIFVDNGGTVGEFQMLKPYIDTYIKLNTNTGAYLARNIGSIFAKAPILLFLEDDGIPANNLIKTHLDAFAKYDVIAVRGVYRAKSGDNPLNKLAKHYYLGDLPFPRYSDLEGNSAYDSQIFFRVGGWDDEIFFGGGGIDLAIRLMSLEPDMCKQIYSPEPVLFHDYATDGEHLKKKRQKQIESFERLRRKHKIFDSFHRAWVRYIGHHELIHRRTYQFGCDAANTSTSKNTLLDEINAYYQSGNLQQTEKLLGRYQHILKQEI